MPVAPSAVTGRTSSRGPASAITAITTTSRAKATGPVPQPTAAVGSAAPCSATVTSQATHQDASVPNSRPTGAQTSVSRPPARPSTVAGPTTGATSRLAA